MDDKRGAACASGSQEAESSTPERGAASPEDARVMGGLTGHFQVTYEDGVAFDELKWFWT